MAVVWPPLPGVRSSAIFVIVTVAVLRAPPPVHIVTAVAVAAPLTTVRATMHSASALQQPENDGENAGRPGTETQTRSGLRRRATGRTAGTVTNTWGSQRLAPSGESQSRSSRRVANDHVPRARNPPSCKPSRAPQRRVSARLPRTRAAERTMPFAWASQ